MNTLLDKIERFLTLLVLTLTVAAVIFSVPVISAYAQESLSGTNIRLGSLLEPWMEVIIGVTGTVVTLLVGWVASAIQRVVGYTIEQSHRDALQTAITNAAGMIVMKLPNLVEDVSVDVKKKWLADGIIYVNNSAADALKYFNLDHNPEAVEEKIIAKVGVLKGSTLNNRTGTP